MDCFDSKNYIYDLFIRNFGLSLDLSICDKFFSYYEMLIHWNQRFNLTRILEFKDVVLKHFIDSCCLLKDSVFTEVLNDVNKLRVLDLGSGAGFPGIPLSLIFPNNEFTLLESNYKKSVFLKHCIDYLPLNNVLLENCRSEDFANNNRECFDLVVSRAVADTDVLLELSSPFVSVNGFCILYKTNVSCIPIDLLNFLGFEILSYNFFDIFSDTDIAKRSLLLIEKKNATPYNIPRRPGLASKKPLFHVKH